MSLVALPLQSQCNPLQWINRWPHICRLLFNEWPQCFTKATTLQSFVFSPSLSFSFFFCLPLSRITIAKFNLTLINFSSLLVALLVLLRGGFVNKLCMPNIIFSVLLLLHSCELDTEKKKSTCVVFKKGSYWVINMTQYGRIGSLV